MADPLSPPPQCPICRVVLTSIDVRTVPLEVVDRGPDGKLPPIPLRPDRRFVPGETTTTYEPCGHVVTPE